MTYYQHPLTEYLPRDASKAFKSNGERKIARFLDDIMIKYRYESGVLVYDKTDQPRIWYPDFHLIEFGTYIEYFGLVRNPEYHKSIQVKEAIYDKNHIDVISFYPWMFEEEWQGHIVAELESRLKRGKDLLNQKLCCNKAAPTGDLSDAIFYR